MENLKISVEGIGDFVLLAEPTILQRRKVDIEIKKFFGNDYNSILSDINENFIAIRDKVLQNSFNGRSLITLSDDEKKSFAKEFDEDFSIEKQVYQDSEYMLHSVEFMFLFPELCVSFPEGFTKENFREKPESMVLPIMTAYLKLANQIESKKKISMISSDSTKKSE